MGIIYALCGPSGVGKTSLIHSFLASKPPRIRLLSRTTARPTRKNEKGKTEYEFTDTEGFLRMLFANEFIDFIEYDGYSYGIRSRPIEETIRSNNDGLIMAGTSGAVYTKQRYRDAVSIIYLYPGSRDDLLDPGSLDLRSEANLELVRRLKNKINEGILLPKGNNDKYVESRMKRSFVGIAFINGQIRSGLELNVIPNRRDKFDDAVREFISIRMNLSNSIIKKSNTKDYCFVLMPFKSPFDEIYEDHIETIVRRTGLECLRGDKIFSSKPIMDDILDAVRNATIIISDLSGSNPNVYYETGLCHSIGKEVVLITQDDSAPFDIQHFRRIQYQYTPRGMKQFEDTLEKTIREMCHL